MRCPRCDGEITRWQGRPRGVLVGYCGCQRGPVVAIPDDNAGADVLGMPGIGDEVARILWRLGYHTPAQVCGKSDEQLRALPGLGDARVGKIREWCNQNIATEVSDG
jgi:hypothetical protein